MLQDWLLGLNYDLLMILSENDLFKIIWMASGKL